MQSKQNISNAPYGHCLTHMRALNKAVKNVHYTYFINANKYILKY
jgi:hypothetical protein